MDQLTSAQISEWEAYYRLDPSESWKEDFRMANILTAITNIAIGVYGKKGTKLTSPIQFMPDWSGDGSYAPRKQTVEEMKEILMAFANDQNKRVTAQGRPPARKTKEK